MLQDYRDKKFKHGKEVLQEAEIQYLTLFWNKLSCTTHM
jgi:hypothetical protein